MRGPVWVALDESQGVNVLSFFLEALGTNLFPAHLSCWQDSVPYSYRTEIPEIFWLWTEGYCQLLEATTFFGSSRPARTSQVHLPWSLSGLLCLSIFKDSYVWLSPPDNPEWSPSLLVSWPTTSPCYLNSLLPCNLMCSQVLGLRMWTSLGCHYSDYYRLSAANQHDFLTGLSRRRS